jgi:hypothetical protein
MGAKTVIAVRIRVATKKPARRPRADSPAAAIAAPRASRHIAFHQISEGKDTGVCPCGRPL